MCVKYKPFYCDDYYYDYILYVIKEYNKDLHRCESLYDYNEMIFLLHEWVFDYVGNMNLEETDNFLISYCYRKALFNYITNYKINISYYLDKQIVLNRLLVSNILFNAIKDNIMITQS